VALKILIVEDNTDSRDLLNYYFSSQGFKVVTATNGAQGFMMAQAEKPDIIITDIFIPVAGGLEMIKQVQLHPEIAAIPIVIYTAQTMEAAQKAIQAGALKAFYKPIDLNDMIQYIKAVLHNSPN
jgi:CheY-like chemotaxis protein